MSRNRELSYLIERLKGPIIKDLTDRRGMRQAWESIDVLTQQEIRRAWIDIVRKAATDKGQ